jgi:hypothetical protein
MSTDTRPTPHTDALDTLGSIITENEKRDAIHLAVYNAVAAHTLRPGDDVGFQADGAVGIYTDNPVGIVDPFLKSNVQKGQRFWLVVYPRQITSLRHVWTHPAFPEGDEVVKTEVVGNSFVDISKRWIEEFARKLSMTYGQLMAAAQDRVDRGHYTLDNGAYYADCDDEFPTFWMHYQIVTGVALPKDTHAGSFFTCSC